jgi:hypothetical protein
LIAFRAAQRLRVSVHPAPQSGFRFRDKDTKRHQEHSMLDLVMLAIALSFFALSVGYTIACDRL